MDHAPLTADNPHPDRNAPTNALGYDAEVLELLSTTIEMRERRCLIGQVASTSNSGTPGQSNFTRNR
jgi:hypothetical protein